MTSPGRASNPTCVSVTNLPLAPSDPTAAHATNHSPEGDIFWLVNAENGERTKAFQAEKLASAMTQSSKNHQNRLPTGFDELDDIGVRADRRYLHDDAVLCLPIHTMRSSRNGIPD